MTRISDGDFEISRPYQRCHAPYGITVSTDYETFIQHLPTGHFCNVLDFPKKKKYKANSLVIQYDLDMYGRYPTHAEAVARAKEVLILQSQGVKVKNMLQLEWEKSEEDQARD